MWWPLFELDGNPPCLESERFRFTPVVEDIQKLNQMACDATAEEALEITAMSCACANSGDSLTWVKGKIS